MKRLATFALILSLSMCLTSIAVYAQSRGTGRGPSVSSSARQGHGPQTTSSHGKPENRGTPGAGKATFIQRIERNQQLSDRLGKMLPPETTLQTAADGFKNQGQFIAALHVSQNLVIPFADLKNLMTTGEDPKSLGEAIHELKPTLTEDQVEIQVETAQKQAKETEKNKDLK